LDFGDTKEKRRLTMRRSSTLIVAALLASGVAIPAFAALEPVGSVDFSMRDTHDSQPVNVTGDALTLTARGSDVMCDSVMATFGNGRTREVFRGNLPRGQSVTIDLPGRQRMVERLDFNCRPTERYRARVDVAADTGFGDRFNNRWFDEYGPRDR
jgi:hypothetical protein